MSEKPNFTDREWHLIEQGIKPIRFHSEEYTELYEKIRDHENQL